ncbi:S1C family serine protease [Oceanobacillus halophilus]|uniref:Serine protease n=1 Tax=Oceanobacillus halophilus TaxID=930130 RepID=A0A495A026_9BACI|nr:serine protease [Oceanobacillus halophilus]
MEHNNNHYPKNPEQNNQENLSDSVENQETQPNKPDSEYQTTEELSDSQRNIYEKNPIETSSSSPYSESNYTTTKEYNSDHQTPQPSKQKSSFKSGIVGGIIGGIISAVIVTLLFTGGILNIQSPSSNVSSSTNQSQDAVEVDGTPMIEELSSEDAEVSSNIQEVSKAVVGVVNLQQQSVWTGSQEAGTGSGIIYKKENGKAYVVTNQHVVHGAQQVEVVIAEEERIPATVLGEDSLTDLAVLEIDGAKIDTVANIGTSEDLIVGETVLAIGNPLGLEFANSVTKGIISGLNRSVEVDTNSDGQADWVTEVLQTDAAINPGNSGGALVNADGEVVGINSMKIAQGAVEGIGFAIPVNAALPIMEQLETNREVVRPQIGISTAPLYQVPPQVRYEINLPEGIEGGMVIASVQPNSPADQAGLQQFDIITKIDGNEITSILELRKYLYSETTVGDEIEIEYIRDGDTQTTNLELAEMENGE